jgi:hypothetical protein
MARHYHIALLLLLAVVTPATAQQVFKAVPSAISVAEGGIVDVLLIQVGEDGFSLCPPKGYGTQVHPESSSVVFTSESGTSTISMQVTTNFPGTLPKMEDLGATVAKKFPRASLVQSSRCISDLSPGLVYDLFLPTDNNLMVRIRDAYFSYPKGSFEFTFTCNGADYDKNRLGFVRLLNSFRSQPKPAKKEP